MVPVDSSFSIMPTRRLPIQPDDNRVVGGHRGRSFRVQNYAQVVVDTCTFSNDPYVLWLSRAFLYLLNSDLGTTMLEAWDAPSYVYLEGNTGTITYAGETGLFTSTKFRIDALVGGTSHYSPSITWGASMGRIASTLIKVGEEIPLPSEYRFCGDWNASPDFNLKTVTLYGSGLKSTKKMFYQCFRLETIHHTNLGLFRVSKTCKTCFHSIYREPI